MIRAAFLLCGMMLFALTGVLSVGRRDSVEPYYLEYSIQHMVSGDEAICRRFYFDQTRESCDYSPRARLLTTSLDGQWRAYVSSDGNGNTIISRKSVHGRRSEVIGGIGAHWNVHDLTWSPNGRWLAISMAFAGSDSEIYRLDMETGELLYLRSAPDGPASRPAWSADSAWIAYNVSVAAGDFRLFVMRADGSDAQEVVPGLPNPTFPAWSPDGEWLVFQSNCSEEDLRSLNYSSCFDRDSNLYRLRLSDGFIQTVAARPGDEYGASFSPDGQWIAYIFRNSSANPQIYRVHPDGTDVQALTSDPDLFHWFPSWIKTPNFAFRPIIIVMIAFFCLIVLWWTKP
jgi:Tol biopolymer transport system component